MARVCYRLWVDAGFLDDEFGDDYEKHDFLYGIDEDYTSKKEWQKEAEFYTKAFNERFGTDYTSEQFFGKCEDIGWRICSKCGESFWGDDRHECEDRGY